MYAVAPLIQSQVVKYGELPRRCAATPAAPIAYPACSSDTVQLHTVLASFPFTA
jgi:hypothetical protein